MSTVTPVQSPHDGTGLEALDHRFARTSEAVASAAKLALEGRGHDARFLVELALSRVSGFLRALALHYGTGSRPIDGARALARYHAESDELNGTRETRAIADAAAIDALSMDVVCCPTCGHAVVWESDSLFGFVSTCCGHEFTAQPAAFLVARKEIRR